MKDLCGDASPVGIGGYQAKYRRRPGAGADCMASPPRRGLEVSDVALGRLEGEGDLGAGGVGVGGG